MSGIAGIYYLDGRPVRQSQLESMATIISHRGPDGCGYWCNGSVGLAHRMLWTTPESLSERLPLESQSRDLAITADARIDNRAELGEMLGLDKQYLAELSDSGLVLLSYEKWQERCVDRLIGDFAFAIWDGRRKRLFCARDHFGVKPFVYHLCARSFYFASEIKALVALTEVPREVNEIRIADYLAYLNADRELTFYKGIVRLPPAHYLTVDASGPRVCRYWQLDPARETRYSSDGEYEEAYRHVFSEAVRCRLRSAYPVGSMLSGGLDSASIVAVARDVLSSGPGALTTFSGVFDEQVECDEREYIKELVKQGGLDPVFVPADNLSPLADLERLLWHNDEPFFSIGLTFHSLLHQAAGLRGCRLLLDGFGGDQVVGHGGELLADLAKAGQWGKLGREVRWIAANYNLHPLRILWRHVAKPSVPLRARQLWRSVRKDDGPRCLLRPELAQRTAFDKRVNDLLGSCARAPRSQREAHWRVLSGGVAFVGFEELDRSAASTQIEARYPYLDRRMAEFCVSLPAEQKLRHGWLRSIARRSYRGLLPQAIVRRSRKADFTRRIVNGLQSEGLAHLEAELLHDKVLLDYVSAACLRRAFRKSSKMGISEAKLIARSAVLGSWLRRIAEQQALPGRSASAALAERIMADLRVGVA